ncbi:hypothetical protein BGZ81_008811 [Podila clonocystis]|nr:hypothetical protein BGZ81_008811 [Podila clonocystis]
MDRDTQLRVATKSLQKLLRPQFQDDNEMKKLIQEKLDTSQLTVTKVKKELAFSVEKSIAIVVSGKVYGTVFGRIERQTFAMASVLPREFDAEPGTPTEVTICSIPTHLQSILSSAHVRDELPDISDLRDFLSQGFVQSLYSATLGTRGFSGNRKHPLWGRVYDRVKAATSVKEPIPQEGMKGLSGTFTEAIAGFTVGIKNMFSPDTLDKSVKACVEVLFKQHLDAPWERQKRVHRREAQPKTHSSSDDDSDDENGDRSYAPSSGEDSESDDEDDHRHLEDGDWDLGGRYPSKKLLQQPLRHKIRYRRQLQKELTKVVAKGGDGWEDQVTEIQSRITLIETAIRDHKAHREQPLMEQPVPTESDSEDNESEIKKGLSKARLKVLVAITMKLLFDPKIHHVINTNVVSKAAYHGTSFSSMEMRTILLIANGLRRWCPKKVGKVPIPGHSSLYSPMMLISNIILTACGYGSKCYRTSPRISAASVHALPLTYNSLYEILCSKGPGNFDVAKDLDGEEIISGPDQARGRAGCLFGAFFDQEVIDETCRSHGIVFDERMTYVHAGAIRIHGKRIPDGEDRHSYTNMYLKRKANGHRGHWMDWASEAQGISTTEHEACDLATKADILRRNLESLLDQWTTRLEELKQDRANIGFFPGSLDP